MNEVAGAGNAICRGSRITQAAPNEIFLTALRYYRAALFRVVDGKVRQVAKAGTT